MASPDIEATESHQVILRPSGKQFRAQPHETILAAALRSGIALPYRCANGKCGACKTRLITGSVARCKHSDFPLSELDRQQNYHLLCTTTPTSKIEIATRELKESGDC